MSVSAAKSHRRNKTATPSFLLQHCFIRGALWTEQYTSDIIIIGWRKNDIEKTQHVLDESVRHGTECLPPCSPEG